MDSITQIVLGAAVGEAVLGKKIGNRALVWGGIAGTIPDLDVFASNLFISDMSALAFHRGPSHSLLFAVVFSFLIALLTQRLYSSGLYQRKAYKWTMYICSFVVLGAFFLGIWKFTGAITNSSNFILLGVFILLLGSMYTWLFKNYVKSELSDVKVPYKEWYLFFFLTIVTHPILDCFTTYGTQILWPFNDKRVAWDNISVADPFYTGPFLLAVLVVCFIAKGSKWRSIINWMGIGFSILYMIWSFTNLHTAREVFSDYLSKEKIEYSRLKVSPTILNNFLWFGVAETDTNYVRGWWSTLDAKKEPHRMFPTPKNHDLVDKFDGQKDMEIVKWFSDGYYQAIPDREDTLSIYDLRYGFFMGDEDTPPMSVMGMDVVEVDGKVKIIEKPRRPPKGNFSEIFKIYIDRIRGLK